MGQGLVCVSLWGHRDESVLTIGREKYVIDALGGVFNSAETDWGSRKFL